MDWFKYLALVAALYAVFFFLPGQNILRASTFYGARMTRVFEEFDIWNRRRVAVSAGGLMLSAVVPVFAGVSLLVPIVIFCALLLLAATDFLQARDIIRRHSEPGGT
ncbi:hypothetical protein [uncultured Brevundimonas sp.]|uniref:hypothetical protein n=1 Tax=uncultured Brevundimonas sp. TaxID=213418 RepID=UPI0030EF768C